MTPQEMIDQSENPVLAEIGLFDLYQQLIVKSIIDYRDQQNTLSDNVNFEVSYDLIYMPQLRDDLNRNGAKIPLVVVYPPNISPSSVGSTKEFTQDVCTFVIQMVTEDQGNLEEKAEQAAVRRLKYLIQQVRNAIYRFDNTHFGKKIGELAKRSWASINFINNSEDRNETAVIGAEMTFTLELPYYPPGITKPYANNNERIVELLKGINIDGNYFDLSYNYN
jgi:hypothetical protein